MVSALAFVGHCPLLIVVPSLQREQVTELRVFLRSTQRVSSGTSNKHSLDTLYARGGVKLLATLLPLPLLALHARPTRSFLIYLTSLILFLSIVVKLTR